MIAIHKAETVKLDYEAVVRRSPVAGIPTALGHLRQFLRMSTFAFVGYIEGEVACVYGVISPSLLSNRAYLWLLTTDVIDEHKFLFVRHSQMVVEELLQAYETIQGDTVVNDHRAIRWLQWLGAEFDPPEGRLARFVITPASFAGRRHG